MLFPFDVYSLTTTEDPFVSVKREFEPQILYDHKNWEIVLRKSHLLRSNKIPKSGIGENSIVKMKPFTSTTEATTPKAHSKTRQPRMQTKPLLSHIRSPHFGIIQDHELPKRPPLKASYSLEGTFLWTVGLFGTVENGAIVLTTVFCRGFRKPLHLLVSSLASADLFISAVYIPSYTYYLLEGTRPLTDYRSDSEEVSKLAIHNSLSFCSVGHAIFVEVASVTLTLKALIAIYLYISSVSKSRCKQYFRRRNTITLIMSAWLINFIVLFLPAFLGFSNVDFYPDTFQCIIPDTPVQPQKDTLSKLIYGPRVEIEKRNRMLYTFTALVFHLIELLISCFCFVKVHNAIVMGRTHWRSSHQKTHLNAFGSYSRALKTMILIFISFFLCWIPIYVINIIDPFNEIAPRFLHHIAMDLLLLKSAINPSIYIYAIRTLRYEMKAICLCQCRKKKKDLRLHHDSSCGGHFDSISTGCAAV